MTTWHTDFDEGFWFATSVANNDEQEITRVVCLNLTETNLEPTLAELIQRLNTGWIPPD
jgi:hypothetical protein